ncbi:MAG: rnc [Bacteroidetes bacterium]|nr:rnc [Bacteroidota bacterium]
MKYSFRRLFHLFRPLGAIEWARKLNRDSFNAREFQKTIGYKPKDWKLFFESLLHRSYLQFVDEQWNSNERLEFLGDALLNFIVADYLHSAHPTMEEGELTKYRSRLVNRRILAQRAKELQISEFLFLSTSATQSIGSGSESILADAFEALIGALYLDLEYSQGRGLGIPRYAVVREEGPEHDRRFTIEAFVGSQSYGMGTGRSKKDAEQAAAAQALERINQQTAVQQS